MSQQMLAALGAGDDLECQLLGQICRSQILRQRSGDLFVSLTGNLEVGTVASDPHHNGLVVVGVVSDLHRRVLDLGFLGFDLLLETEVVRAVTEVEVFQLFRPLDLPSRDVVEPLLHARGELGVHVVAEVRLE